MSWKGAAIGGYLGSLLGGPLGTLLGAVLGHQVEKRFISKGKGAARAVPMDDNRSMIFCASAAAMLAKMAKADGQVSRGEIASVERAFGRLGFSSAAREYAIRVFRKAKDDAHTIYEYAAEFSAAVGSVEVKELFYEILWEIACADGVVGQEELAILQRMPRALGIRNEWYGYFFNARMRKQAPTPRDELAEAYGMLGASSSDSVEELKRKYREMAKKNHPDVLRAQGLPEEMIGKATERMGRINAAWAKIKEERGI